MQNLTNQNLLLLLTRKQLTKKSSAGLLTHSPFPAPSHLLEADSGIRIAGGQKWSSQQRDCPGFAPDSLLWLTHSKWEAHR